MKINIMYTSNNGYAYQLISSIHSLLKNNKTFEEIYCYIVDDNIEAQNKKKIIAFQEKHPCFTVNFIDFRNIEYKLNGLKDSTGYKKIGYARLLISDLINEKKLLYLDCDTIINGDLLELWNTNLDEYYFAAVQDNPALYAVTAIGMTDVDRYINAGVMLINITKWKEDNIENKCLLMIRQYNGFVQHHDQGIINGVCREQIKIIQPKFNCMSQFFSYNAKQIKQLYNMKNYYTQKQLDEAIEAPIIIHYISKFYDRPWNEGCNHPFKELYYQNVIEAGLELNFAPSGLKYKVKIRRFILQKCPFFVYYIFEKFLDVKRKQEIKNKF